MKINLNTTYEMDNKQQFLNYEKNIKNKYLKIQNEIDFLGLGNHIRVVLKKY